MGPIFLVFIVGAILMGVATGQAEAMTASVLGSSRDAVELSIKLIGVMAFFLGLMEVVRRGGLMPAVGRALAPLFRRLFPDVPDGHPALAAMTMNIAANMLGLTNAATPFGLKAMKELDRLNGARGVATDAMCLFLAINTSNVSILPLGTIGWRATLDSQDPSGIVATTWIATVFSTLVAGIAAIALSRLPGFRSTRPPLVVDTEIREERDESATSIETDISTHWIRGRAIAAVLLLVAFVGLAAWGLQTQAGAASTRGALTSVSHLLLPAVILLGVLYGWSRGVHVYEALVTGAKEGFDVAVRIIPFLVAILVAVGLLRASGALEAFVGFVGPYTAALGFPAEALPMAILRPLSGSGAMGVMVETMKVHGPDSFVGYLVSTLQGSTETTFYVIAVYGGAVGLKRLRHALVACLIADAAGIVGATAACHLLFSHLR